MENFKLLRLTKAKSAYGDLQRDCRMLRDRVMKLMKLSIDKCKVNRNDPDIMYYVMDSELTITPQKWGLRIIESQHHRITK